MLGFLTVKKYLLIGISLVLGGAFFVFGDIRVLGMTVLNTALKISQPIDVDSDIAFGNEPWQKLDVYPAQHSQALAPVIVFIHGGAWYWGNKDLHYFAADAFVRRGYVVVVPDYTKYPEGRFPAFIEDGAQTLAWVKSNIARFGGDPNRLFLSGHSAGAHTGALLSTDARYLAKVGMTPRNIRGFAGIAGPYNFTPKWQQYIDTFGEANFETMKASTHVNGDEPPMLLIHSTGDSAVGQFNQETLFADLTRADQDAENILYGDEVSHISIMMKLHPWFADDVDVAKDIDHFFRINDKEQ